jgi:hypothetical protein
MILFSKELSFKSVKFPVLVRGPMNLLEWQCEVSGTTACEPKTVKVCFTAEQDGKMAKGEAEEQELQNQLT